MAWAPAGRERSVQPAMCPCMAVSAGEGFCESVFRERDGHSVGTP